MAVAKNNKRIAIKKSMTGYLIRITYGHLSRDAKRVPSSRRLLQRRPHD
jgi:hypothetical protein